MQQEDTALKLEGCTLCCHWQVLFCWELVTQDAPPSWFVHKKSSYLFCIHAFMAEDSLARQDFTLGLM